MTIYHSIDVLIIGSGAAGLSLALRLADECNVTVISKGSLNEGCTFHAQGGIAAVLGEDDSIASHIKDTINAGAGLCDPKIVRFVAEKAKDAVQWLINKGVTFSKETRPDGRLDYHLTREGGHSYRRVIHAEDATGQAIETTLVSLVKQHSNITCLENHTAIDLIIQNQRCTGAYILDNHNHQVKCMQAKIVVLATGGASKVYL